MAARDPGGQRESSPGEQEHEDECDQNLQTTEENKSKVAWTRFKHASALRGITGYEKQQKVTPGSDTPTKVEMSTKPDKQSRKSSVKKAPPSVDEETAFVRTGVPVSAHPPATPGAAPAHQSSSTHQQTRAVDPSLTYDHLIPADDQVHN